MCRETEADADAECSSYFPHLPFPQPVLLTFSYKGETYFHRSRLRMLVTSVGSKKCSCFTHCLSVRFYSACRKTQCRLCAQCTRRLTFVSCESCLNFVPVSIPSDASTFISFNNWTVCCRYRNVNIAATVLLYLCYHVQQCCRSKLVSSTKIQPAPKNEANEHFCLYLSNALTINWCLYLLKIIRFGQDV